MNRRKQVVLVSLTLAGLEDMLGMLDFSWVELLALVTDSNDDIDVRVSGRRIPFYDFSELDTAVREMQGNDIYWLVCGYRSHLRQFGEVKRMLESLGCIDRQRIIIYHCKSNPIGGERIKGPCREIWTFLPLASVI